MATFGFGRLIDRPSRRGETVRIPEFRLHIQTQWRIARNEAVLVGYADWHWPPEESGIDYADFDPAEAHRTRQDELRDAWLELGDAAHVVASIRAVGTGDFTITFVDGCVLETFADHATRDDGHDELWRLLPPDASADHFVVTAHGLDG